MKKSTKSTYEKAKRHIAEIKGFFNHLMIFIIGNILYAIFLSGALDNGSVSGHIPKNALLINILIWGFVVLVHGLYVFKSWVLKERYRKWETKRILQIMEQEEDGK